jgi:integrase/recombinase XerD
VIVLRQRSKTFHADLMDGRLHVVRGSLGTRNQDAARRILHRLEIAISEGNQSKMWLELKDVLPCPTYSRFADFVGVQEKQPIRWKFLLGSYMSFLGQQITLGKLRESTVDRYKQAIREFQIFLDGRDVDSLEKITKPFVESFKIWRLNRIMERKYSRGAGLVQDMAILHRLFSFAIENELITKNPVRLEGRPGANPMRGAEPFTGDQLSRLRRHAGADLLTLLLLRWTGLRGSDAVALSWREVHFEQKEIERLTQKRKKRVILPIHRELLFALRIEYRQRSPAPYDCVLLNPISRKPLSRPRLYERMLAMGRRAGVLNAHPHRFRDTLAVDMLVRGATPYDVAKVLGDTIETVERHYTPFVPELRERVRLILEQGVGLEERTISKP